MSISATLACIPAWVPQARAAKQPVLTFRCGPSPCTGLSGGPVCTEVIVFGANILLHSCLYHKGENRGGPRGPLASEKWGNFLVEVKIIPMRLVVRPGEVSLGHRTVCPGPADQSRARSRAFLSVTGSGLLSTGLDALRSRAGSSVQVCPGAPHSSFPLWLRARPLRTCLVSFLPTSACVRKAFLK